MTSEGDLMRNHNFSGYQTVIFLYLDQEYRGLISEKQLLNTLFSFASNFYL